MEDALLGELLEEVVSLEVLGVVLVGVLLAELELTEARVAVLLVAVSFGVVPTVEVFVESLVWVTAVDHALVEVDEEVQGKK